MDAKKITGDDLNQLWADVQDFVQEHEEQDRQHTQELMEMFEKREGTPPSGESLFLSKMLPHLQQQTRLLHAIYLELIAARQRSEA